MDLVELVMLALAATAIVTAWFYGSIFEKQREYFKERPGLFAELMRCLMCFPYHVAFWSLLIMWLPGVFLPEPWKTISRIPLYAFAITTLVHFAHRVLPLVYAEEEDDDPDASLEDD